MKLHKQIYRRNSMKRFLTLLLTASMLLSAAAALTGCSSGGTDSTNTDEPAAHRHSDRRQGFL